MPRPLPRPDPATAFDSYGRSHHLRITSAQDLKQVLALDEALWVATGAPVASLNFDATFLKAMDVDRNGRLMCYEVKCAIRWLLNVLEGTGGIGDESTTLTLSHLNANHPDATTIRTTALKILAELGKSESDKLALADLRRIKTQVAATPVSEAGVVVESAEQPKPVQTAIHDLVAVLGGAPHPTGKWGIDANTLKAFGEKGTAFLAWVAEGRLGRRKTTEILPLGKATAAAWDAMQALRSKLDQYFAQCRAVAYDSRLSAHLALSEPAMTAADLDNPDAIQALLAEQPLAPPSASQSLALAGPVNATYANALTRLWEQAMLPAFGDTPDHELTATQWDELKQLFAPYARWLQRGADHPVAPLGPDRVKELLKPSLTTALTQLVELSAQTAMEMDQLRLTEKLILFQANMLDFANNFVSFPQLYDPDQRAVFEQGSLVMDGRRFTFSVRAAKRAEHSKVAAGSNFFILYVQISPPAGQAPFDVALPVTSGTKGNLCVGKRGVFTDIAGRQLDAQVVQIIENPISILEAMLSPFVRFGKMLGGKIESITSAAEKQFDSKAAKVLEHPTAAPAAQAQVPAPPRGALAGGLLMGGGVAVAAMGSAMVYTVKTIANIGPAKILIGVAGAFVAVLLPVAILAILKLRSRDLSAILEAGGWAINARMRLSFRQGRLFTYAPHLPPGAARQSPRWVLPALGIAIVLEIVWLALRLAA